MCSQVQLAVWFPAHLSLLLYMWQHSWRSGLCFPAPTLLLHPAVSSKQSRQCCVAATSHAELPCCCTVSELLLCKKPPLVPSSFFLPGHSVLAPIGGEELAMQMAVIMGTVALKGTLYSTSLWGIVELPTFIPRIVLSGLGFCYLWAALFFHCSELLSFWLITSHLFLFHSDSPG